MFEPDGRGDFYPEDTVLVQIPADSEELSGTFITRGELREGAGKDGKDAVAPKITHSKAELNGCQ